MEKTVPVVIYTDGQRQVVGEAVVNDDRIVANIGDPHTVLELHLAHDLIGYSVATDPTLIDSTRKEEPMGLEFKPYVRKPFTIEAIEVTEENMEELATSLGIGKVQPKRNGEEMYILVDAEKIPNVFRIYIGFFVTRMGGNIRAYSAKTFRTQFASAENGPPQEGAA